MRFKHIEIEGFLSIGSAKIDLANRGLVLIEGKNLDDSSARSNGAGKSSIVDGLCWCLYGKTARGLSGEEVINHKSKSCKVTVWVEEGDTCYQVTRSRKGKTADLTLTQNNKDGEKILTKGTIAETQVAIEKVMGCSYAVFVAAVYAGQEAMPDLPAMTDKQLKELLESVIGVEKLSTAYRLAQAEAVEVKHTADKTAVRLDVLTTQLEDKKQELAYAERLAEEQKVLVVEQIKNATADVNHKELMFEEAVKRATEVLPKKEEISNKIKSLDESISNIKVFQTEAAMAQTMARDARIAVTRAESNFDTLKSIAKSLANDASQVASRVGTKCKECGKEYTAEDIKPAKEAAVVKAKQAVLEAQTAKKEVERLTTIANDLERKAEEANKAIPSSDCLVVKNTLLREYQKLDQYQIEVNNAKAALANSKKNLESLKKMAETRIDTTIPVKKAIKDLEESITKVQADYYNCEKAVAVLDACKDIFGPTGVRQHVLDTVTPILNDRTARYLDVLSDGKLQAVWTTLTRTKKGEVKEKFNIMVSNRVGGGSFESLSGGEKRKVRVACCLALQELVASRATKPIELFIADEVDHALDDAGVERLIGVLNEKAECCKSLFVISHNPLRNWIENTITVIKHDGISTIE